MLHKYCYPLIRTGRLIADTWNSMLEGLKVKSRRTNWSHDVTHIPIRAFQTFNPYLGPSPSTKPEKVQNDVMYQYMQCLSPDFRAFYIFRICQ